MIAIVVETRAPEQLSDEKEGEKITSWEKQSPNMARYSISRGIIFGAIGGLAGMIVMDIVMIAEFSIMGLPVDTYLDLIGSVLGGGVPLGAILHLLLSSLLGIIFSTAVLTVNVLRISTVRKGAGLGVLAGIVTIPFGCIPFAIITDVPIATLVGFSALPHLVYGAVLGIVVSCGLR